ncbi:ABC-type branched-chain amino acid transport system, ATPase component [Halogeometricum borinquense DSM 11551]|uniref:ABC-type branched-chain amino acid transport system, ATPase component n=1 Tax=Halogeometricum borinquense (strain ATCC 700274 / DSM 11551 / JCM 10706 / KCTC 4070 / PR3) TaxID=469382 RepID=E4NVS7_HALBP|nr:ABC-type branched-chain amino acid transport system, ATPase component [Halogeometricum borinquense DSM 11551]ELY31819.1 ABC-type branched-chain amino acid transport system, ATPase component [Halogeometricum borinquense DSM 11551]
MAVGTTDVRLEADVEAAQQNRSLYRHLLVLQFQWVPDCDTFILVRHQQANGKITMVDDRIVPKDQTTANSK